MRATRAATFERGIRVLARAQSGTAGKVKRVGKAKKAAAPPPADKAEPMGGAA